MAKERPIYECIDVVRNAPVATTYWGNWLVKNTIILASGYGGISKTTFFFSLLLSLLDDGQFLGVVTGEPITSILYCDLESNDSLEKTRMKLIGKLDKDHPEFYRINQQPKNFKELVEWVEDYIAKQGSPSILVIDPMSLAFPETQNENSNAEATRQSQKLRRCLEKWQTTMILVSHSSKLDMYGVGHNRGASARAFLCDIAMNFHRLGEGFPENQFVLHIPKNRWIHDEFLQCIEASEGDFNPMELPPGALFSADTISGLTTYQMQLKIQEIMKDGIAREVRTIIRELGFDPGNISESLRRAVYRAILPLIQLDKLNRLAQGIYQWSGSCVN